MADNDFLALQIAHAIAEYKTFPHTPQKFKKVLDAYARAASTISGKRYANEDKIDVLHKVFGLFQGKKQQGRLSK